MKHTDLIDRLNAGSGPDRELDRDIRFFIWPNDADTDWDKPRNYSESLDACIGLMRAVLPGWRRHAVVSNHLAEIGLAGPMWKSQEPEFWVVHEDECRALLIAILQAVGEKG